MTATCEHRRAVAVVTAMLHHDARTVGHLIEHDPQPHRLALGACRMVARLVRVMARMHGHDPVLMLADERART